MNNPFDIVGSTAWSELSNRIAAETENSLLRQLEDLVKRDLLVVERQPAVLVVQGGGAFSVTVPIRLKLRNHEYVEKLEKENAEMKAIIVRLREVAT